MFLDEHERLLTKMSRSSTLLMLVPRRLLLTSYLKGEWRCCLVVRQKRCFCSLMSISLQIVMFHSCLRDNRTPIYRSASFCVLK